MEQESRATRFGSEQILTRQGSRGQGSMEQGSGVYGTGVSGNQICV